MPQYIFEMKFIALEVENPGVTVVEYEPYLRDEAAAVWQLIQEEVVREIYFRADQHTAVVILECEDNEAAQTILASLPLVQAGLIHFDLLPLRPYSGLSRLFTDLG